MIILLRLNMPIGSKLQVILAFSFRLPLMVLSGVHLLYSQHYLGSTEPQFTVTNEAMLQQALLIWSLVSATIPSMRPFIKSLGMNMGFGTNPPGSHRTLAATNTFALQTIGSMPTTRVRRHSGYPLFHQFTPGWEGDESHTETVVTGGSRMHARSGDGIFGSLNGSEEMIIRKSVQCEISEEPSK